MMGDAQTNSLPATPGRAASVARQAATSPKWFRRIRAVTPLNIPWSEPWCV